ncbi:DUF1674 domain-containing protein [Ostreibacterium oceani]|nr:DUF1674 domain-containing protein [Ostreibacterium oceani]
MTDAVKIYRPKKNAKQPNPVAPSEKPADLESAGMQVNQANQANANSPVSENMPKEYGGRKPEKGLEPTRYGDWEFKGRCIDF